MSQKIMLPMDPCAKRDYAVTWTEQHDLAGRYGMTIEAVRVCLNDLYGLFASGVIQPQKTGNKTKAIIQTHIERSNATERQGA